MHLKCHIQVHIWFFFIQVFFPCQHEVRLINYEDSVILLVTFPFANSYLLGKGMHLA